VENLKNLRHELADISETQRRHIRKLKLRNLKLTVISKSLGTFIVSSMILRRFTNLELLK